ncbi:2-amino-4-hydroxy-6-hydroxymethyldihydropteridine diphosphokinase [Cognatiluteimonas telluris]|jgi:2-amino-4-hydroxy-6-hydroxymethyldihydropteridine diphosphokinase|uniref:2-amino-4-hydroxy-6- hydroxymethyldihydropteridine diphosphokinase n=1 Tax=Cognatiluteimonas telluris TaxID=1104775 RepID=UPI00140E5CD1|nr:2-amino-4-hydroxy-6-hydroxymethyldihydropteridine diphosphokinase [Lysobacter telluris]
MTPQVIAAVGLGGNLDGPCGSPEATLRQAMVALGSLPRTQLLRGSSLFRTPAWGDTAQPDFINAVALLGTCLPPRELLDALLALERRFGRDRSRSAHWGPRTLDLDLLLHGGQAIDEPGLHVPHPHLHQRAFVLLPLAQIAPDLQVPGRGQVAALLARVDATGCVALPAHEADAGDGMVRGPG